MFKNLSKPIIILGFGRSGTSIVADIILNHKSLAYVSNYNAFAPKSKLVNLMRLPFDNKLYKIQGQKKQLNKVSFLNKYTFKNAESYSFLNYVTKRDFGIGFLNDTKLNESEICEMRKKFNQLVKLQLKSRLAFKTTGPSRLKFLHQIFPDAQFIFLKREPLPNISSLLKVGFYQDRKTKLHWKGKNVYSIKELEFAENNKHNPAYIAALQYFKVNQMHNREIEELGIQNQIHTIQYERFVENPEAEITRVLDFVDLNKDKSITSFMQRNKIENRNKPNHVYFGSAEEDKKVENIAKYGL